MLSGEQADGTVTGLAVESRRDGGGHRSPGFGSGSVIYANVGAYAAEANLELRVLIDTW